MLIYFIMLVLNLYMYFFEIQYIVILNVFYIYIINKGVGVRDQEIFVNSKKLVMILYINNLKF